MALKIKRILGVMMALVLILSTGLSSSKALAASSNKGTITVNGTTTGKNYSAYKIFDLTQSGENVSYTIAKEWKDFFTDGAGTEYIVKDNSGKLNPIVVGGEIKYINITESNISEFAKAALGELNKEGIKKTQTKKQMVKL